MGIKVRIDPVEQFTQASINAALSDEEQRQAAAEFVRDGIEEAQRINQQAIGRKPKYTISKPLERINPAKDEVFVEFDLFVGVLAWIKQELIARSPRVSGDYIRGHQLFADGQEVTDASKPPDASEYVFINTVPYARKIEIGKTKSSRSFVIQVEPRIYERVAIDARSRFGNVASIKFGYRTSTNAYSLRRSSGRRRDRRSGAPVQSPAIIVTLRGG